MKNLFLKLIVAGIMTCMLSVCEAQQILPLNSGWPGQPDGSYFKDLKNELDEFTGVWKAFYGDKIITLSIVKQLQMPFEDFGSDKCFFKDQLSVRYEVITTGGVLVHSTLNNNFELNQDFEFLSVASRKSFNEVTSVYRGGSCSIGLGIVYLKKINATQFQWNYKPQTAHLNDIYCPRGTEEPAVYLPTVPDLVFTKQ